MLAARLHSLPDDACRSCSIAGANSDVVDDRAMDTFRAQAPHAKVDLRAKAGHMVAGDRNDAFGDAISAFLDARRREAAASPGCSRTRLRADPRSPRPGSHR